MRLVSMALSLAVLMCGLNSFAADPKMAADREAINAACAKDSATASCGDMKVGTGLLKCLGAYRKANPSFKISDACRDAMKKAREDRKAAK